ncbi:substrate-binding periplasmic protein [Undibacterium sp.]|uniref:substrate-binding periplasmic protein n=1 Tax=Undibacterium sp. TaxID=1914977 RepID=UPI00374FE7F1
MNHRYLQCLLCFGLCAASVQVLAADVLKLLYEIREPLSFRDERGKLTGLVVTPVEQAMTAAKISSLWIETPFKRQLSMVEANDEAVCAVGLYKNKDRQRFAKFSHTILRSMDRPSVILAHRDFQPDKGLDLLTILSIPGIKILKKDTASYGSAIDDLIERSNITVVSTTAEAMNMAKMIAAKRADFILTQEGEALNMIKSTGEEGKLHIVRPLGMPQGPERYLMCSERVSDELLQRFNKALVK